MQAQTQADNTIKEAKNKLALKVNAAKADLDE